MLYDTVFSGEKAQFVQVVAGVSTNNQRLNWFWIKMSENMLFLTRHAVVIGVVLKRVIKCCAPEEKFSANL